MRPVRITARFDLLLWILVSVGSGLAGIATAAEPQPDYNRDIRPILSNYCYTCHGPDEQKRQTELRLDQQASATVKLNTGIVAIVPGNSAESELYQRIVSTDATARMPPPDSGKTLTPQQIKLLKDWIDGGAVWQGHWSFQSPRRSAIPPLQQTGAVVRNAIDHFVLERLDREGLHQSSEADRATLCRRVTLDLTGLPPTLEAMDVFLADESVEAYEKLIDRLLESPHYGEHLARTWLDMARYGDTHGLFLDNERSLWPYRDWVIRAFNTNLPFDQFTIEQLAGDLLPAPTLDQRIATGFNRCNVTTNEPGSIVEEARVRNASDRVETTAKVWLGLTAQCAACHDHKFDPLSQAEFYQLFAYFANGTDKPLDDNALLPPPFIQVPTLEEARRQSALRQQLATQEQALRQQVSAFSYVEPTGTPESTVPKSTEIVWIDDALPSGAVPQGDEQAASWKWVSKPGSPVFSGERSSTRTAKGLGQHYFTGAKPGLPIAEHDTLFAYVYLDPANPPRTIMLQAIDASFAHRAYWGENLVNIDQDNSPGRKPLGPLPETGKWVRLEVPAADIGLKPGTELNGWNFVQFDGTVYWDQAGVVTTGKPQTHFASQRVWEELEKAREKSPLPAAVLAIIKLDPAQRNGDQIQRLRDYFIEFAHSGSRELIEQAKQAVAVARKQYDDHEQQIGSTMVMEDRPGTANEVFVLTRGEYDKPDKNRRVLPNVPAALPALPADAPPNRLALARWLCAPEHPLTARVIVNRFWQQLFGIGIVGTSEDFGAQGEWPSHPELLDWLALDFIEHGWDVKRTMKQIVLSATYRQDSHVTPELARLDRENRLLARGPRFRVDAEVVRDATLAASGLLFAQIGGRSVRPYQPPGIWEVVAHTTSNTSKYQRGTGEALFRRSLYTFWKRTAPPPGLMVFDAPTRDTCTARRPRTNTPLQALALMNDEQYIEAARKLAERILREGGTSPESRLIYGFRLVTARRPEAAEQAVLARVLERSRERFHRDPSAAEKLLATGESPRPAQLEPIEHAAYTLLANLLLNLDEAITKE